MALTDLSFPVTAKKDGPGSIALSPPRVFYLKSSDLISGPIPAVNTGNAVIKVKTVIKKKLEIYETPDEFLAMQALAQGATASAVFTKAYGTLAPTSSATSGDGTVPAKYYNQILTSVAGNYVRLPDPFSRRLVVIDNLTTGSININARGTTSPINGVTSAYVIGPLERIHFVAPTAATANTTAGWKVARDVGAGV
jgi:hypothetical protein